MTDALSRGEVRNRTRFDFWCLVSDRPGDPLWAFKLLPGQRTDPRKNDVDFCKPVDPNVMMQGRANQWWKVRGSPILLSMMGAQVRIAELSVAIASLSRIKDSQDFRRDDEIERQWNTRIRCMGARHISDTNSLLFDADFTTPLTVPAPPASSGAPGSSERAYTVQAGDWLSKIAMRPDVLKDALLWPLVHDFKQNRSIIGEDPNKLRPGMVIVLPQLTDFTPTQMADARRRGRDWRR
jgi:hypothetical protein